LKNLKVRAVTSIVQSRLGQQFANPETLVSYLSSDHGRQSSEQATKDVDDALMKLNANGTCKLSLTVSASPSPLQGGDPISQLFLSLLEQSLPPNKTLFSYFPADRAMPVGEVPVQLGGAEAASQMESHNSQPQLKYHRLKSTLFSAVVAGSADSSQMEADFRLIFGSLLKELKFSRIGISNIGTMSILVEDFRGRQFQMDHMSSGEKGLILTFMTIARTLEQGGIVLLDEPEQHLNPAVCKELLPFLIEHYAVEKDIQFIICSRSPEILAGAFGAERCSLWHIISANQSTKLRLKDQDAAEEALRHLGTSQSENLIYKGLVFVEGVDDVEILETGFVELLARHKIIDMGGRPEIEKTIAKLQASEGEARSGSKRYFIFDRDKKPTSLGDSRNVKVRQLDRYCIENYLIDVDVIVDFLLNRDYCIPIETYSRGVDLIKRLAMSQIDEVVISGT
jgi:putative AbiEii toxin of type IV toxin-antitoxin system/uncharacterized protein DUF4435